MASHDLLSIRQFNTLTIVGTLHDENGAVLNIPPDAALQWRLADPAGAIVRDYSRAAGSITVLAAPNGQVQIVLNSAGNGGTEAALALGTHTDEFRVTIGTWISTQWIGSIEVKKSLFTSAS